MEPDLFDLNPATRWIGTWLEIYREVDSTNLVAEQLAAAGAPEGTLVLADRQTAGRGRLGRSFHSPGGLGLYMSVILRPELPGSRVHQYIFVAAVAVAECVRAQLPDSLPVEIKWPNDVLLAGRKTSGINLPVQLDGDRVRSAVLGIGVNLNNTAEDFPPELRESATSLRLAGSSRVGRTAFAEALLLRLEAEIEGLRSGGFGRVLEGWEKFFRMRGARVRIGGPGLGHEVEGVIEGVDSAGALLLRANGATERILAGDVTVLHGKG
ncbi:MAG: biotin--[acetyl-CoA-carboxylase] ligase [Myxococcota bacterium]